MINNWCVEIVDDFLADFAVNKSNLKCNKKPSNKITIKVLQKKLENVILPKFFPNEYKIRINF